MENKSDIKRFSDNLRYLCGFYSSISEVCRKLDINRQQFNRYLRGGTMPSYSNLKKICDFFGVDSDEMTQNCKEFEAKVFPQAMISGNSLIPDDLSRIVAPLLAESSAGLEQYQGFYYRYFYSFGFPGHIFRSFLKIYEFKGVHYYKHIERTTGSNPLLGGRMTIKYRGLIFYLADRLYLIETENVRNTTISETILMPNYRPGNRYISGLMLCASTGSAHQPGAARTIFEFLGKNIDVRDAMRKCDLYHYTDKSIPKSIKQAIRNNMSAEEFTFHPPRN